MVSFINSAFLEKNKLFYSLLENISLEEKKADLDRYYINTAKDICNELKFAISVYEEGAKPDGLIITPKGWKFNSKSLDNLPSIFIDKRNPECLGEYSHKYNAIILYLLDDNYNLDNFSKQLIVDQLEKTLIHELTHFFDNSMTAAAGRSVRTVNFKNDIEYYQNEKEINAFTKELEVDVFNIILNGGIKKMGNFLDIDDQKDFLHYSINNCLLDLKNNKKSYYFKFLNTLTEKQLKKVYKEIYQYCIDEYLKFHIGDGYMATKLRHHIYNSDALNDWFKKHGF